MTISFHGAARTVTGSKHLITLNSGEKILLDCGLFQGLGAETEDLNAEFGFDPKEIHSLLLSHAHIDHTGLIPQLVKEGFRGKIYCTEPTKELTAILLSDSAEIQAHDAEHTNRKRREHHLSLCQPLYNQEDVGACLQHFATLKYNEWTPVHECVEVLYMNAGHLPGSAAINIRVREDGNETTILYSGDIGRYRSVLLNPPGVCAPADYIILESTYGDKHHDITFNTIETLQKWIKRICLQKKGKLIIPAFSVGRTQEVLYALNQLSLEKRLPDLNYYIDSPLSLKATSTIKKYTDEFNARLQQVLTIDNDPFEFPGLKYIEDAEDSRKLVESDGPCVIISASGTADAGRVRHHINSCIDNPNAGILLVGYCGPRSLGGQLMEGCREVDIFGETCNVRAQIGQLQGMSAHGDCDDLCRFLSNQHADKVKRIFLVHGEYGVQQKFASKLEAKGFHSIYIPKLHEEVLLKEENQKANAA